MSHLPQLGPNDRTAAPNAGSLTGPAGAIAGCFPRVRRSCHRRRLLAVEAFVKMLSTRVPGGGGNLHLH
jgi:hypothetical protein